MYRLATARTQAADEQAAPVRGVDGGQRGDGAGHAEPGDGVAGIQTALGMGDDMELFTVDVLQDLLDLLFQFGCACLHRGSGLLPAIEHGGAVSLQFPGDPAPVVEHLPVTEKDAVDQQDGIPGFADFVLLFRQKGLQLDHLKAEFFPGGPADLPKQEEVENRHPPKQQEQHPPEDAELFRGGDDPDKSVGKQQGMYRQGEDAGGDQTGHGEPPVRAEAKP